MPWVGRGGELAPPLVRGIAGHCAGPGGRPVDTSSGPRHVHWSDFQYAQPHHTQRARCCSLITSRYSAEDLFACATSCSHAAIMLPVL